MSKLTRLLLAVLLLALVSSIAYLYLEDKKATLKINAEPPYRIFINNREYTADSNPYPLRLQAGTYRLLFLKEHFSPIEKIVELETSDEQQITLDFSFTPYLESSSITKAQIHYSTLLPNDRCESLLETSGGSKLFYCVDHATGKGVLQRVVGENPPQTIANFLYLNFSAMDLSRDEKKLLIYSSWQEDGSGYLVDLQTGYKELLWQGLEVASASFANGERGVLLEKIIGEQMYDILPVDLLYLSLHDRTFVDTGINMRREHACVLNNQLYIIPRRETILPNKLESLEDLKRSFSEVLENSAPEATWTQVLEATDLANLSTKQILVLDPDVPELGNLVCDEQAGVIYLDSLEDERHYVIHITEP